jgi:Protein of unknown function (DUF2889)
MPFAPHIAGPHDPRATTPTRLPGSARRTTTIDTTRPDGLAGRAVVDARARDLLTSAARPDTEATAAITLDFATDRTILTIGGDAADLTALVGANVMRGFRRALAAVAPDDVARATLRHSLLDDLVGAALVSGMAPQHEAVVHGDAAGAQAITEAMREHLPILLSTQVDICAGWATDASMVQEIRRVEQVPAPLGPVAPTLEGDEDPMAWHRYDPLPPHATRRRRRLDLGPIVDGVAEFDTHFRDSHVDRDGVERVVHEYSVSGSIDATTRAIGAIEARVQVLPWLECPSAIASASRVVGVAAGALRDLVRTEFRGTSTCTHLNDTLRSLADLDPLLGLLARD